MRETLLIVVPLVGALVAAAWRNDRTRPWLLPVVGVAHAALCLWLMVAPPPVAPGAWIAFDALTRAVLPAVSLLFLLCAFYSVTYLRVRTERPNRVFVASLLAVMGLLSAGHQARHLGILWIGTEAVTLAAVPLLHFNNAPRAFEATWKYLLVGGTGIAISLLGSFCLGYASLLAGGTGDLTFAALAAQGATLSRPWVLIAWTLLLVGYGTKMGLAPMHTWKPDAYGEAPGVVGALMAGGVTTVAFTAILRVRVVIAAAGASAVADRSLLVIGLFSLIVAAVFLLATRDFKRMLGYSSVEHMGLLSVGASLGAAGVWAALFHVWSNSITKGALFLGAANLRRAAGSASIDHVRGATVFAPRSAMLFVAGMFAITATPPFAPFFSELRIIRAGVANGHWPAMAILLACLLLAFLGMSRLVFAVVDGRPHAATRAMASRFADSAGSVAPPLLLLLISLWLGLFTPTLLQDAWSAAVTQLYPGS